VKDTLIKIGEDGEVLIKGPQVMKGCYKNEAATKEAFTQDGFFRTGGIGEIDRDRYLKITGRIKDIIVTSGGKNISPQNTENAMLASAFIEQPAIHLLGGPAGCVRMRPDPGFYPGSSGSAWGSRGSTFL
jgi:long-chain acyl-CoA synthetase